MKQILLMIAVVAVVGCGEKADGNTGVVDPNKPSPEAISEKLIADPIVEKAIRKRLKKPGGELTKADMEKVTRLGIENKNLTDVPGGLGNLSQLTYLSLALNQLTNVEGLEKLKKLETLSLVQNNLTDVKSLGKLDQLTDLHLWGNKLTELPEGLEKLDQLTYLSLSINKLTDVKGLENLTQLEELVLDRNQLTDVKGLEKLTKLKSLVLWNNKLTNVKGLNKLTKLVSLDLSKNQLTDVNGLEKLTQLTGLGLKDNPDLTKAQIAELQKALPKCKIHSNLPLTKEESAQVVEAVIRKKLKKPIGELTKADFTKVTRLDIRDNGLTDVKGLEKLTQLTSLDLRDNKLTDVKVLEKLTQLTYLGLSNNPDLTTTQINQLKKTMPKCLIGSNPTK